jgi:hypothetical protein
VRHVVERRSVRLRLGYRDGGLAEVAAQLSGRVIMRRIEADEEVRL